MILHTVNKSPFTNPCFIDCLKLCVSGSSILLIEDGVYTGQKKTTFSEMIEQHPDIQFFALEADTKARGLDKRLSDHIKLVDDEGFVDLVTTHHAVQSWY